MPFAIPSDHPCLPGHFPGRPLVPGVVLLDQVIAAVEAAHGPSSGWRLPQVKFLLPLLPEQSAQVELEALGAARWRFRVRRGEDLLASGEVVADPPAAEASA